MKEILISVIIPVYNVQQYLEECLDSILNQTFKSYEVIIIDDGSTDSCGAICDLYAERNERIRVLHTVNQGLSEARNTGISMARGKYLAFIDSDDYVDKTYLKKMYQAIVKTNAEICESNYICVYSDRNVWSRKMEETEENSINAIRRLFAPPYLGYVNTWNKLYKRELFENIRFPKGKLHEDEFTTYKLLYEANKIVYINEYLYFYRQRENSIMNATFSKKRLAVLESLEEKEKFFADRNIDMNKELGFHRYVTELNILNAMVDSRSVDMEVWNAVYLDINSNRKKLIRNSYLKVGHKISLSFIKNNPDLYILFRKFVQRCVAKRR